MSPTRAGTAVPPVWFVGVHCDPRAALAARPEGAFYLAIVANAEANTRALGKEAGDDTA